MSQFNDFSDFDKRFNRRRDMFKLITLLTIVGIVLYAVVIGIFVHKAVKKGVKVYTISVYSYRNTQNFQSDSIISQSPNTIHFIDLFGRDQTVSGETITVTGYNF